MNPNIAPHHPRPEIAINYFQEMWECTLEHARSQIDMARNIYREAFRETREMLTQADSTEIMRCWPRMLESAVRKTTECSMAMIKDNTHLQNELMEITQDKMPELSQEVVGNVFEPLAAVGQKAFEAVEQTTREMERAAGEMRESAQQIQERAVQTAEQAAGQTAEQAEKARQEGKQPGRPSKAA